MHCYALFNVWCNLGIYEILSIFFSSKWKYFEIEWYKKYCSGERCSPLQYGISNSQPIFQYVISEIKSSQFFVRCMYKQSPGHVSVNILNVEERLPVLDL